MPITITGDRANNVIDIPADVLAGAKGSIEFVGTGAKVAIGPGCRFMGALHFKLGPGSLFSIGQGCHIGGLMLFSRIGAEIRIGNGVGTNGLVCLAAHEIAPITIGDRSLIAGGVKMNSSDMHSIIDVQSGRRVNPSREIKVGEHVWIGLDALILPGAKIGADSIIGARSVVSGEIPANCVAAGVPARVLRHGVTWARELTAVDNDPPPPASPASIAGGLD